VFHDIALWLSSSSFFFFFFFVVCALLLSLNPLGWSLNATMVIGEVSHDLAFGLLVFFFFFWPCAL
jgi:hypothetical protein